MNDSSARPAPRPQSDYPAHRCGSCYWMRMKAQFNQPAHATCNLMPAQLLVLHGQIATEERELPVGVDPRTRELRHGGKGYASAISANVVAAHPPIDSLENDECVMWRSYDSPPGQIEAPSRN